MHTRTGSEKTAESGGSQGRARAAVRVLCVDGELGRQIVGYGDDPEEAVENAAAEARAFCRFHGGTQKITSLERESSRP